MENGNEKSCPECAAAWNRKLGRFPGIDPNAIEVTTFGIYGFEEKSHHKPDSIEDEGETVEKKRKIPADSFKFIQIQIFP